MSTYPFFNSIEPDVTELIRVIQRKGKQKRLHFLELYIDPEIKEAIIGRYGIESGMSQADGQETLQKEIMVHRFLGYDVFRIPVIRKDAFALKELGTGDTAMAGQSRGERAWIEEHAGPIRNWEDFEAYQWPDISSIDLSMLDWMEKYIPEGMGCFDLTGHILEVVSFLLGYETMCMKMYDEPDLIDAMFEKVGAFYTDYTRIIVDYSCVPLIWGSDDFGFKSSTLVSPNVFNRCIFPWHRKCSDIAHDHGKPYILHSCGYLEEIMDSLIDDVGIDSKHSFEDIILPVTEALRQYGSRISIIGGIDVDFLCRNDEASIRKRVRETLDVCIQDTGYCFGTGNSVANYIPVDNFLVMLDEAYRYGNRA